MLDCFDVIVDLSDEILPLFLDVTFFVVGVNEGDVLLNIFHIEQALQALSHTFDLKHVVVSFDVQFLECQKLHNFRLLVRNACIQSSYQILLNGLKQIVELLHKGFYVFKLGCSLFS